MTWVLYLLICAFDIPFCTNYHLYKIPTESQCYEQLIDLTAYYQERNIEVIVAECWEQGASS